MKNIQSILAILLLAALWLIPSQEIVAQDLIATEIGTVVVENPPCRCDVKRKLMDQFVDDEDTLIIVSIEIIRNCPDDADCVGKKCKYKFKAQDPDDRRNYGIYREEADCIAYTAAPARAKSGDLVVVEPYPVPARCKCPITITTGAPVVVNGDTAYVTKASVQSFCLKRDCSDECSVKYSARGNGVVINDAIVTKDCEKP